MRVKFPFFILLLMLALAACQNAPAIPATPPVVNEGATTAVLNVNALPEGAQILVNGVVEGASPLTLELAPGVYTLTASLAGYASSEDTLTLEAGQEAIYAPELADIASPVVELITDRTEVGWNDTLTVKVSATDNAGPVRLELLLGDESLALIDEGEFATTLIPADTPGMTPGREIALRARATDGSGNIGEATVRLRVGDESLAAAAATLEPAPAELVAATTVTPESRPIIGPGVTTTVTETVHYEVTEITLPTYPYAEHLSKTTDPLMGDYPVIVLDRAAYETTPQTPAPVLYRLLTLENSYLKLQFLPDLGGRLYGVTFKPTGNEEMYQNPVVKPTVWGPGSPPAPQGANWWPAVGGMEWGFPVDEHGYEFGTQWGFDNVTTPDGGVMVSLFTRDPKLPHIVVDITLEPDQAFFTMRIRIINPWSEAFRLKWWHTAALAPGPENTVSENLRFIWPAQRVSIHSTGDLALEAGQALNWPNDAGRDLSRLGEWSSYLGLFQLPAAQGGFAAVYDPSVNEGMVRTYPPETAKGAKFFSAGWQQALDPGLWTDNGSRYVEMQGGLMPTYADWYDLGPGEEVDWTETWYPVAGIGDVTYAGADAAVRVEARGKRLSLGAFPTQPFEGDLKVSLEGAEILSLPLQISPEKPFVQEFDYSGGAVRDGDIVVSLVNRQGAKILEYRGKITLQ